MHNQAIMKPSDYFGSVLSNRVKQGSPKHSAFLVNLYYFGECFNLKPSLQCFGGLFETLREIKHFPIEIYEESGVLMMNNPNVRFEVGNRSFSNLKS